MNETALQLSQSSHAKAIHLLDEIKRQSNSLSPENEANGHVINSLAESVAWLLISAQPVEIDNPL
ncbi:hypothetical protein JWZ98_22965 (plasmid) [Methylomonas sp. EFPC1]|uniref:hypothetical protein n=1 Tax=Methylomonas sp. EFPC1 TaxID=2812647 RepID=UPI00196711AB|nr:hypothetical protein [Methylomonas sp. EFPC1]QSB03775.1 hypothetical protein JWZ98_22965 [Methylomonas sp. EFPC1]